MKRKSIFGMLLYGTWTPRKPNRSKGIRTPYKMDKQTPEVQQLISAGYFNNPTDAQEYLDTLERSKIDDRTHAPTLPKLTRPKSFSQRLSAALIYILGESSLLPRSPAAQQRHDAYNERRDDDARKLIAHSRHKAPRASKNTADDLPDEIHAWEQADAAKQAAENQQPDSAVYRVRKPAANPNYTEAAETPPIVLHPWTDDDFENDFNDDPHDA